MASKSKQIAELALELGRLREQVECGAVRGHIFTVSCLYDMAGWTWFKCLSCGLRYYKVHDDLSDSEKAIVQTLKDQRRRPTNSA